MTLFRTFDDDGRFDADLKAAEDLWREAGQVLNQLTKQAMTDDAAAGAMKGAVAEYSRGYNTAVTERSRVANDRRRETGANGSYAIDFDAARAEIGRRLACLRAAGDG